MIRCLVPLVVLLICLSAHASNPATIADRAAAAKLAQLSFEQAEQMAGKHQPHSIALKVEFNSTPERPVYSIWYLDDVKQRVVTIDANTGDMISSVEAGKRKDLNVLRLRLADPSIDFVTAIDIAKGSWPGTVPVGAEIVTQGERMFIDVWLVEDTTLKVARITPTGEITSYGERKKIDKPRR